MCFNNRHFPLGTYHVPITGKPCAWDPVTGVNTHIHVVDFLACSDKGMTGDGDKDQIQIQIDRAQEC